MCGIAGILAPLPSETLERLAGSMADRLRHRGPDGSGVVVRGPVALAHRRLSIIDLGGGAQPLANEDEQVWITFNGEIYNYRELRRELTGAGHRFRTQSDTEVIVHAYEEWGDACVTHLRGMFAFAITDLRRGRVFLARDHFGIKPLVYAQWNDRFAFASEVQALRAVPGIPFEFDQRAIDEYLHLQYIPAPRTAWTGIRKLAPAHTVAVDFDGRVHEPTRYWRPPVGQASPLTEKEWLPALEAALDDSVRAHMIADVPVGAFLSGGLDSTATVGFAHTLTGTPIHTFSIGFEEVGFDESAYAAQAAELFGTAHRREYVRPDALGILPELVRHYGEPFGDSSAVPTWYVSQLAATDVKTVITGDGGDEAMAGYGAHRAWLEWFASQSPEVRKAPPLAAWMQIMQYLSADARRVLWRPELVGNVLQPVEAFEQAWREADGLGPIHRVQYMDAVTYLPNDILTKVDIASMRHSLETRTPMTDVNFWEVAARIPERMNIGADPSGALGGKQLLKQILRRWFPEPFVSRPKQGFAMPLHHWFGPAGAARTNIEDRILGPDSLLPQWFEPVALRRLLDVQHDGGIWLMLVLGEWMQQQAVAMASVAREDAPVRVVPEPAPGPAPDDAAILLSGIDDVIAAMEAGRLADAQSLIARLVESDPANDAFREVSDLVNALAQAA